MVTTMGVNTLEGKKFCVACGSDKTSLDNGIPHWRIHNGEYYCHKCHMKYFVNPKWSPINDPIWNKIKKPKRMSYGRVREFLSPLPPREGKCYNCNLKLGDEYINSRGKLTNIKQTQRHHWFYLVIMPWACTQEVCASCHVKITRKSNSLPKH